METRYRKLYNDAFSDAFYRDFIAAFEEKVGCAIPYRVAETPFFIPDRLRDRLANHAREILDQALAPAAVAAGKQAIPAELLAPGTPDVPDCVQIDFAVVEGPDGELDGKVVELQAFPSLYALMALKREVISTIMAERIVGLDRPWSIYYDGLDDESFTERLRSAVVGDHDPENVVLLDLTPEKQKTYPDFAATQKLLAVDPVCPTTLEKEGKKLFRRKDGKKIPIERIYNRVVFDELARAGASLPFSYTEELDVTWCSHPNWYWIISKDTLPRLDHPAVPRARTLAQIGKDVPEDLSGYVLKPLFSFAGSGVLVDPTHQDVADIPPAERNNFLLQEKITYHPGIVMPDDNRVKAEVRMMFLRGPEDEKPELVLNLVRLSRGKMLGVDQNKGLDWVGGSIGIWPEAEGAP